MRKLPKETKIKPVVLQTRHNIIALVVILTAGVGVFIQWEEFQKFFFPDFNFLTWRFLGLLVITASFITWFIMNNLWKREYDAHELTKADRDNLMEELKISENERLTDVITGIPNARSLEKDIQDYFSTRTGKKMQFILIDLKNFRSINTRFGYTRTNKLLRLISQSIYRKMRRNEDMYKYFDGHKRVQTNEDRVYRVYPGGDEFAFVIQGDQSDAIGFCNRLVDQFNTLTIRTKEIVGEEVELSFYCSIIEMDARDSFEDILKKAEDCYQLAKEGVDNFVICWHPINVEQSLSELPFKKSNYERARTLFQVTTLSDEDYN
ncbi:MAG: GGDEF domain-containing protein [Chryseobacterium sp.]|nr:MAG: GGDEF domain-containing protein [Chryseobacterium sp.]